MSTEATQPPIVPPEETTIAAFADRVFAGSDVLAILTALNVAPATALNVVEKVERQRHPYFADTLTVADVGDGLEAKFRLDGLDR